jgi:thiol peroxidase
MEKRQKAVTFKGNPLTLVGPQLKPGDRAPGFTCVNGSLELVTLEKTPARPRVFSVVPSLDTPVCSLQTKKFEEALGSQKDKVACYTISLDLPFAQKRFCGAENISNIQTLSDVHDQSFGKSYGVLIEGLPLPLLSRAVFVVDGSGKITYAEYVPEVGQHPNYDAALAAVKSLVGA